MPTSIHNPALFPAFVAQHTVLFDETDPHDLEAQFPGIVLPETLASAVRKRQIEYVAGRYCARQALRKCTPEAADVTIETGPNREPLWPADIVGAITHTRGYASVALAKSQHARAMGLDAELWMAPSLATQVADHLASRDEVHAVADATGLPFCRALTVIFSAKETLFKCLFPEVQRYFGFRDAQIRALDVAQGRFEARLTVTLTPSLRAGDVFEGRFESDERRVYTGIIVTR